MERFEIGMLAVSRAGHDKDCLYVISAIDGEYVYLTDGRLKPLEHPKKKKTKHIHPRLSERRVSFVHRKARRFVDGENSPYRHVPAHR